jgi:hypothetical protein
MLVIPIIAQQYSYKVIMGEVSSSNPSLCQPFLIYKEISVTRQLVEKLYTSSLIGLLYYWLHCVSWLAQSLMSFVETPTL